MNYHSNSYSSNGQKFMVENNTYPRDVGNSDGEDDDNATNNGQVEDEDEDEDDDDDGVQRIGKDDYVYGDEDDNNDDDNGDQQSHPKKRKLKNLISSYEFAPKPSSVGGRNPLTDWTEHETLVLLDAWGDRFLKRGRKSLRSEEWQEVAEKVSQESKIERTDTQCRNRLDKYKKEKMKLGEGRGSSSSEWLYFNKIDVLLSSQLIQQTGLSCGEYVFMNPNVYLNSSNGLDEMMDSPGNSTEGEVDMKNGKMGGGASFKMLADSFQKFSEIYERIESSKREQMVELEKMRVDFHRDLELQKRQIVERFQEEIAKIRTGDNTVSAEKV